MFTSRLIESSVTPLSRHLRNVFSLLQISLVEGSTWNVSTSLLITTVLLTLTATSTVSGKHHQAGSPLLSEHLHLPGVLGVSGRKVLQSHLCLLRRTNR